MTPDGVERNEPGAWDSPSRRSRTSSTKGSDRRCRAAARFTEKDGAGRLRRPQQELNLWEIAIFRDPAGPVYPQNFW